MEKIITPADRVLTEIGRLVLMRPLFSGVLLISAIIITLFSNQVGSFSPTIDVIPAKAGIQRNAYSQSVVVNPAVSAAPMDDAAVHTQDTGSSTTTPTTTPTIANVASDTTGGQTTVMVKSGDTLASLFKSNGLSTKEVATLSHLKGAKTLHHLKTGQQLNLSKDENGKLQQLTYALNDKNTLYVVRSGNTYKASTRAVPITVVAVAPEAVSLTAETTKPTAKMTAPKVGVANQWLASVSKPVAKQASASTNASPLRYVSGQVTRSLSTDARKAGLSTKQTNQLLQIFGQKNLAQNIRRGDTFSVLYENSANTNAKKATSNILVAQLTHRDKTYQLIRFTDPKGHTDYYTPQGQSLRDGLVREPVQFTHISSYFSNNRLDPVLGFRRPHEGVDFAAPTGTPVRAAGEGVVAEVGYNGGYGKSILLQHDDKYSTRYAHLSKFASNLREGGSIQKGQVIGFVGQTGFATGPHLHFEIRVNEVPANPLTVALPSAYIPKAYRNQFLAQSKVMLAQLNTRRQIQLAERDDPRKQS